MDLQTADETLREYPVRLSIPVAWGDMDIFRHVNNTVFFRYCESARIAYLEAIGFAANGMAEGIGPIISSASCRFRSPLRFPDTVQVGARTSEVGSDRFTMEYRIVSERERCTAADGSAVVVAYDYGAGRKSPLPDVVRREIERVEGRAFPAR